MTQTATKASKSVQKYLDIINTGIIEEHTIIAMKSLMGKNKEARDILNNAVYESPIRITREQEVKGWNFY